MELILSTSIQEGKIWWEQLVVKDVRKPYIFFQEKVEKNTWQSSDQEAIRALPVFSNHMME